MMLIISVTTLHSLKAQWYPDPSEPARLLNDYAGILNMDEADVLEVRLMTYHQEYGVQIVMIILNDFGRNDPVSYASAIVDRWGIGYNNDEKGLLVLVKPKNQFGPLAVAVVPNSYFKDIFNEETSESISANEIRPLVAKGKMFAALNKGLDAIVANIDGNYTVKSTRKGKAVYYILLLVLLHVTGVYVAVFVTRIVRRRRERKNRQ